MDTKNLHLVFKHDKRFFMCFPFPVMISMCTQHQPHVSSRTDGPRGKFMTGVK